MSRLIHFLMFGLAVPAVLTAFAAAAIFAVVEIVPYTGDLLAQGADRGEVLSVMAETGLDTALQTFLFSLVVAAPAIAVAGSLILLAKPRANITLLLGAVAGGAWATFVDAVDSDFSGPGIEWDWPLGGAAFGAMMAFLAVTLLKRRGLLV